MFKFTSFFCYTKVAYSKMSGQCKMDLKTGQCLLPVQGGQSQTTKKPVQSQYQPQNKKSTQKK